jgi:nickel-dependent lactate racemase
MSDSHLISQIVEAAEALPPDRLLYHIRPVPAPRPGDWESAVASALAKPIGKPPLAEMARGVGNAVILVDDLTRPTPQRQILPPLIGCLNCAGVKDEDITLIVALGTHRYMSKAEVRQRFGEDMCSRVSVLNHEWQDPATFVDLGVTPNGTPVKVNRIANEADLLIGVGSIVPHLYAGWAGGAKILQPGICSSETTACTHAMAAAGGDLMDIAGRADNRVRREMEQVAAMAGLDFILNVVVDPAGEPVWAGAGDFVEAHRAGISAAKHTYVRSIPEPADVVVVDARPTTKDYWQAVKSLGHACRGVKRGGTAILVGELSEGIAQTHLEFERHALEPYESIVSACKAGKIGDRIAFAALCAHALIMTHCRVICVSNGMRASDKDKLGFRHADTVAEALAVALGESAEGATVGVIEHGGDVLPAPLRA